MNTRVKILIAVFLFYVSENAFFGWNKNALSSPEAFCDMVVVFGIVLAHVWSKQK